MNVYSIPAPSGSAIPTDTSIVDITDGPEELSMANFIAALFCFFVAFGFRVALHKLMRREVYLYPQKAARDAEKRMGVFEMQRMKERLAMANRARANHAWNGHDGHHARDTLCPPSVAIVLEGQSARRMREVYWAQSTRGNDFVQQTRWEGSD